jgi:polyhydroxyalkanoate synthase
LLQYSPATPNVLEVPLVIFPPWINRFYILDLSPQKSFIRWAVEQGVTVFVVSWKSADASMADLVWDDYIAAQIDAIEQVRARLSVKAVHTIGYCVAGTTLAATLAVLARRGEADRVKSATFFTAQVDFSHSGELKVFIDDQQLAALEKISGETGLPRRALYVGDLQPAARERSDLELCRQQLPARRRLPGVRSAPLERRCHQSAGQVAHELSEGPLP